MLELIGEGVTGVMGFIADLAKYSDLQDAVSQIRTEPFKSDIWRIGADWVGVVIFMRSEDGGPKTKPTEAGEEPIF